MNKFTIKPFDAQQTKTNTNYPRYPFSLLIIGSKGSSKSTTILSMLTNPHIYNKKFNDIYWVSPTIFNDEKKLEILTNSAILAENKKLIKLLKRQIKKKLDPLTNSSDIEKFNPFIDEDNIMSSITPEKLQEIINEQNVIIKTYGKEYANNILLILDDCLGSDIVKSSAFKQLNTKLRHYKISVIFVSQAYYEIPKTVRLNASCLFIYETNNKKEIDNYYNENNCSLSFKDWISVYQYATKDPYNFFQLNYQNDKTHRFLKNMESYIN